MYVSCMILRGYSSIYKTTKKEKEFFTFSTKSVIVRHIRPYRLTVRLGEVGVGPDRKTLSVLYTKRERCTGPVRKGPE